MPDVHSATEEVHNFPCCPQRGETARRDSRGLGTHPDPPESTHTHASHHVLTAIVLRLCSQGAPMIPAANTALLDDGSLITSFLKTLVLSRRTSHML